MSLAEKIGSVGKKIEAESDLIKGGKIQLDFSKLALLRSSIKRMIN